MKVSCIITTYNRPELLVDAIDSVLRQSLPPDEIIVVDDNSSVSYADVIEKYQGQVQFVKTSEGKKGVSAARNTGIELATGDVIAFLDDDDLWLERKVEFQVAALQEHGDCIACSSGHLDSETGRVRVLAADTVFQRMLMLRNVLGSPSKLMVRREAFDEGLRFDDDLGHAEDWDLYLQLCQQSSIHYIRQALICYNTANHQRLTNQFSVIDTAALQNKFQATYKNKALIGEKNCLVRIASYYITGIGRRKRRWQWVRQARSEVGMYHLIWYVFYKLRHRI